MITPISGFLAWIAAVIFFIHRIYVWLKTGEWIKLIVLDFIPHSILVWFEIFHSSLPKITLSILNREIISFLLGVAIISILIFIFLDFYIKSKETKELIERQKVMANRPKKWVGSKSEEIKNR